MQTYREFYEQSRRRRRKRFIRRTLAVALVLLLIFGLAWVIVTLTGGDGEQTALELLPNEKLNINTATAEELTKLPGIGPALSQAIVEYREENGNFSSIEDIMKVSGIGEGRFSAIEEYIYVEG